MLGRQYRLTLPWAASLRLTDCTQHDRGQPSMGEMNLSKMVRHITVVHRAIDETRRAARHTLGSESPDTMIP